MRCQARSWLGVERAYEGYDSSQDDANNDHGLLLRVDQVSFNDWEHDWRYCH